MVTFHQHDVMGTKIVRHRLQELKYDRAMIRDMSHLIALHQRSHGYREQPWASSAVCRYAIDAGPLLQHLHRLTRTDYTARNVRKAERLSAAYDDLEARITALQVKEELNAVHPGLDGSEIVEILGVSSGPQIGKAYRYLLAYRVKNGLVGCETAETVLCEWWEKHHNGQAIGREGS